MRTKGKKKRLIKRYLWSFFIVVIVVEIIITILLFTMFSTTKISNAQKYFASQLEQVCTATDILYTSLDAVANQILTDRDISPSLFTDQLDLELSIIVVQNKHKEIMDGKCGKNIVAA